MKKELTLEEMKKFIRDPDNVNWNYICIYKILSEEFIREFQDNINWYNISFCQNLSKSFIYEFYDKVYWPDLINKHDFYDAPKHVKLHMAINHRELLEYFK